MSNEPMAWIAVAQMIYNFVIGVYLWINRRYQATNKRVDEVKEDLTLRIEDTERALVRVSTDVSHLPNRAEINSLRDDIRQLTGELSETKGRLNGINRAVDLINEFLINQGKDR